MVSLTPKFQSFFPNDSNLDAINFLNSLEWNLMKVELDGQWILFSGDQKIISAQTENEVNSFILGMALGLAVLPKEILTEMRKTIK
jgi:hypothetical protein